MLDAGGGVLALEIGAGNTFANGGVLGASGGGTLQVDGGTLTNAGASLLADGGVIDLTDGLVVAGGTLASAHGGVIQSTSGNSVTLDPTVQPLVITGVYAVDANSTTVLLGPVSNQGTIADFGHARGR